MKRFLALCALLAAGAFAAPARAQVGASQPNCVIGPFTFTAVNQTSTWLDNRNKGCNYWVLYYYPSTASTTAVIELLGAQDLNGNPNFGVENPSASVGGGSVSQSVENRNYYFPWMSIYVQSFSGGGSGVAYAFGYQQTPSCLVPQGGVGDQWAEFYGFPSTAGFPSLGQFCSVQLPAYPQTDFQAHAATATFTYPSAGVTAFYSFGKTYDTFITYAGITGSPSSCTLTPEVSWGDGGTFVALTSVSLTPANGTVLVQTTAVIVGAVTKWVYACSAYPSAGTVSVFVVQHAA